MYTKTHKRGANLIVEDSPLSIEQNINLNNEIFAFIQKKNDIGSVDEKT
jgi:hypothetical protein